VSPFIILMTRNEGDCRVPFEEASHSPWQAPRNDMIRGDCYVPFEDTQLKERKERGVGYALLRTVSHSP